MDNHDLTTTRTPKETIPTLCTREHLLHLYELNIS
jgi:hypothetical protein